MTKALFLILSLVFAPHSWSFPKASVFESKAKAGDDTYILRVQMDNTSFHGSSDFLKIQYQIKKNGKIFLPTYNEKAGIFYGCDRAENRKADHLIQVTVHSKFIGWIVESYNCGNPGFNVSHLIRIDASLGYTVSEVSSKYSLKVIPEPEPKADEYGGQVLMVWAEDQVYPEHGGTSSSFFLPHLYRWNRQGAQTVDLPSDVKAWQLGAYGALDYQSIFIIGLRERNIALMQLAVDEYYKPADEDWYRTIDVPAKKEDAKKFIEFYRAHSAELKTIYQWLPHRR